MARKNQVPEGFIQVASVPAPAKATGNATFILIRVACIETVMKESDGQATIQLRGPGARTIYTLDEYEDVIDTMALVVGQL